MKKILGTIAIAALLSSAVFADVKVSASAYVRPDVMSMEHDTKTEGAKPGISFFNQTLDWTNSEIGVSASTENVGISANIGVDWGKVVANSFDVTKKQFDEIASKSADPNTKEDDSLLSRSTASNVYVDNWNAWFTVAGFKTSIGNFNSRFSGGFLNKDIHDSNISFMPGNWSLGIRGVKGLQDAGNFTRNDFIGGSRSRLATVGDYTFKFGDEMLILAKAGITGISAAPVFGDGQFGMKTGYAFEAAFQMPLLVVDALVRVQKADTVSTSAFITVNPVKAMNLLVGATLGWAPNNKRVSGADFGWGVDLGLRFALSDSMSITAQGNVGRVDENPASQAYKDSVKNATDEQKKESAKKGWQGGAVLNWTMGINDIFKIYAEGGFTGDGKLNTIKAQFGTVIKPVANATVVAAVRGSGAPENGKMTLDIPVSVKVAF